MNTRIYTKDVVNLNNTEVSIYGWVKKIRKLGNLIFFDLFDRYGIVQCFINKDNPVFPIIQDFDREDVVMITGIVQKRKSINENLLTGYYEINIKSAQLLNKAKTTPLIIEEETDATEDVRMQYRYLDLRRINNINTFHLRSRVSKIIRDFLHQRDFIETETPILAKTTPEGARDFLVPTRSHKFYALPQSPQIFKQLLMVAGFDKYFQITKCFRDEDLRSDRQPEFTQVDIEMSFIDEITIQNLIEELMFDIFKSTKNIELNLPFRRIDYKDAIDLYGSDKPDLRFDLRLHDGAVLFQKMKSDIFQKAFQNNDTIKYLIVDKKLTKKEIEILTKYARDKKAKGLFYMTVENEKIVDGSMMKNDIDHLQFLSIFNHHKLKTGTILVITGAYEMVTTALGLVRVNLANILNLIKPDVFEFAWIVNWPLFVYDEEQKRYLAMHHPFTSPSAESLSTFDLTPEKAIGRNYDIVLNGYEVGGGSIRIVDQAVQERMFKTMGMDVDDAKIKFKYLLEAFQYGAPPHGGIALGLDRLMMILINTEYIRDVVAFPKNNNGIDMMLECPNVINDDELAILGIKNNDCNEKQ
ncbi:aspartate--tRNA ligase [Ureaplasma canigenitalium]|uniref:aspartate--tRNA ligase n=1 Tax=Ureaplasma canigenitalium TaxID=42092 RepID=UPI0005706AEF|nr:aspartate--tRNA ligase [Ureaplasma canigenitalium]